jgi:uncharacterized protein YdeI (YjbR/CyaY-like superfamily)
MAGLEGKENLKRRLQLMPDDIAERLKAEGLEKAYAVRPAYQRNDYLSWIARAKREATREKRIHQMLDELKAGNAYMRMKYSGPTGRE